MGHSSLYILEEVIKLNFNVVSEILNALISIGIIQWFLGVCAWVNTSSNILKLSQNITSRFGE